MSGTTESTRIRRLRPAKASVDAWRPLGVKVEKERSLDGGLVTSVTVFLAGSECPFTCVFCDLWRFTLDGPTPTGALPAQLDRALASIDPEMETDLLKLYNASNFFDPTAVPPSDLEIVAAKVAPFDRVTVECHPRLVGDACRRFASRIDGRLEVAMGLETVDPASLAGLNKQMTLEDFARAVSILTEAGISVRAFVLVAPPFTAPGEAVAWAVRSVEHALALGVQIVSLIPTRGGNGEMERLRRAGEFTPPTLAVFEEAFSRALRLGEGVVLADLWDIGRLHSCPDCREPRISRLRRMNRSGQVERPISCERCANGAEGEA